MIVVDASAWVVALTDSDELGQASRRVLQHDDVWAMPAHGPLEALRTLRRFETAGRLSTVSVARHATAIFNREVRLLQPTGSVLKGVWGMRDNLSIYDAPYVVLASELKIPLVTVDRRLARAADALGVEVLVPG